MSAPAAEAAPAPAAPCGEPSAPSRTAQLVATLAAILSAHPAAAAGPAPSHCFRSADALAALDTALREALAAYCSDPTADWERCVRDGCQLRGAARKEAFTVAPSLRWLAARSALDRALTRGGSFAFWSGEHYVRNLVACEEGVYELLVLCWAPGQVSRVHNHDSSHWCASTSNQPLCFSRLLTFSFSWLTCLSGAIEDTHYALVPSAADTAPKSPSARPPLPGVLSSELPCPALQHIGTSVVSAGETAFINDAIALHSVGCAPGAARGAVTLHLYTPPIRRTRLYETAENRVTVRVPGFFSVGGQPSVAGLRPSQHAPVA